MHQPPHLSLQPQLLCSKRRRRQKGGPRVRRGQRWRRCEGVDDDNGGRADSADAELADDAGDVAAAAVARDLVSGAAIPAGGGGGGEGLGCSVGASGWFSRCLTSCCRPMQPLILSVLRRLLSADASPPVCLVCLPSRLPLVCQLVVASPLLSRRRRLRLATLPRPLLRHLVVATRNAPLVAPLPPLDL